MTRSASKRGAVLELGATPVLADALDPEDVARGRAGGAEVIVELTALAGSPGCAIRQGEINGQPGGLLLDGDGRLIGVWALEIGQGQVQSVSSIINPDRLQHPGPLADVRTLLERRER